jgi:hypothetical protein
MSFTSGAMYFNTVLCSAGSGPCISSCHSPCNINSQWLAAYQNYKDCHGNHLQTCGNYLEVALTGSCPILLLSHCTGSAQTAVSIMSTGPGCNSGGISAGCAHGHSGTVRVMGDLNRAALVQLGAGSLNRIWTTNSTTT